MVDATSSVMENVNAAIAFDGNQTVLEADDFDGGNGVSETETYDFAEKLKQETIACRLHFSKFGARKSLDSMQKEKAASAFGAERETLSASKRLLDTKDKAYKDVTVVLNKAARLWRAVTVPYPENGVRLIRREKLEWFDKEMQEIRGELSKACGVLDQQYERLLEAARHDLGELFDPANYPDTLADAFEISWDFPSIDPPDYLKKLNPELYRKEQERVAVRLEEAVELAEQAFLEEVSKLVSHLHGKLSGAEDGKKKMFRDSSVENIKEFVERFKQLNIGSNKELDDVIGKLGKLMDGVDASSVRKDQQLQDVIASGLGKIGKDLEGMIVERPTRKVKGFDE